MRMSGMDALTHMHLTPEASLDGFVGVLKTFGDVEREGVNTLVLDWKPGRYEDRSYFIFGDDTCLWEAGVILDAHESAIYQIATLLRIASVVESLLEARLRAWWAIGLNLSHLDELKTGSHAWFLSCAAFHAADIDRPNGFIEVDGVFIAVDALRRLTVAGKTSPFTAAALQMASGLSEKIRSVLNDQRLISRMTRQGITDRVERAANSPLFIPEIET